MPFVQKASYDSRFIAGTVQHYLDTDTGLQLVHLKNKDRENAFAFGFGTPSMHSHGVAHILEHCVLCGSRRYPVDDPFIKMSRGSCKTFLNAMTYPDRTFYPGASTIHQDLINLFKVYLDAVFFPLLRFESFLNEGFRFVVKQASDATQTQISSSGVVFNEMKGVYSDRLSLIHETLSSALYPDTVYGISSGGDPLNIPELRYAEFLDFHTKHYHPSKAHLLVYGDLDIEVYFELLQEHLLLHMDEFGSYPDQNQTQEQDQTQTQVQTHEQTQDQQNTASQAIAKSIQYRQPTRTKGEHRNIALPYSEGETELISTSFAIGFLLEGSTNLVEQSLLRLTSLLLIGLPGSALRKKIVSSGLAQDINDISGLDNNAYQMNFMLGLDGLENADVKHIQTKLQSFLAELIQEGIDQALIKSALLHMEFKAKEALTNTGSKISLLSGYHKHWRFREMIANTDATIDNSVATSSVAKVDFSIANTIYPFDFINVDGQIQKLKELLSDTTIIADYIKRYLIDNPHWVTVLGTPTQGYLKDRQSAIQNAVTTQWNELSPQEQTMYTDATLTQPSQQSKDDEQAMHPQPPKDDEQVSVLPQLELSELPRKVVEWDSEAELGF